MDKQTFIIIYILLLFTPFTVAQNGPLFDSGKGVGKIKNKAMTEISGIVASRTDSGVLWLHNDPGDKPRLFTVDYLGVQLGTYLLSDVNAVDWEDIAPDSSGTLMMNYLTGYYWPLPRKKGVVEIIKTDPVLVNILDEQQGGRVFYD